MSSIQKNAPEIETAKVQLTSSDWQLNTTVSVPKGAMTTKELVPLAQKLADAVVNAAVNSVDQNGEKISCKKGCGACCRQLVPIAESEAAYVRDLVNAMPEPRRSEVRRRFSDARQRLENSGLLEKLLNRQQWDDQDVQPLGLEYFRLGIPCPFLEAESCSIHSERPISCREYLVTSPAENCARPSAGTIEQVKMPFKLWTALARLEKTSAPLRFINWVPLILALEWVDQNETDKNARPGMDMLREFFEHVSSPKD
jgi:Fe-S-cluster containining protein